MTAVALRVPRLRIRVAWLHVAVWWAASRAVVLLAFGVLDQLGPRGSFGPHFYRHPLALLASWDGVWYGRVAQHGYLFVPGRQSDVAFFPGYPLLLRATGLPPRTAEPLVSNLALLIALIAFYELSARLFDAGIARRATVFASIAPAGFVYTMGYPSSVLFALVCLAMLAALADAWLLAAVFAAAGGLTRPDALAVMPPLAALAWSRRHELDPARRGFALAAVLAAPAAVASFAVYLRWAVGDAHAWSSSEAAWGRAFTPMGPVLAARRLPGFVSHHPWLARDVVALGVYAILLCVARRSGVSWPWLVSALVVIVVPLFSGTVESEARFGLLALPVYWGLAAITRNRAVETVLRALSVALLVTLVIVLPYAWP
ncbi:MAG TPA: hypothetical protein VFB25_06830 [Gaiellaceae bacterium]|nr:hypothetical protein [Gaiellaceae bacterium]